MALATVGLEMREELRDGSASPIHTRCGSEKRVWGLGLRHVAWALKVSNKVESTLHVRP